MKIIQVLILLAALSIPNKSAAQVIKGMPDYNNEQTKEVIENMIEAHGGWELWANAPSIKFDNVFFNTSPQAANPWWVSTEIIEQTGASVNDRKVFHNYHIGGKEGGFSMGYDGNEVWASPDWGIGNYPKFMTYFFYYFLNLPWLTQDDNVLLSEVTGAEYNGSQVYKINMTFKEDPAIGKVKADSYVLFIDQESYQLVAYEYSMGFGAQLDAMGLPKGAKILGPVFRHIDEYVEAGGLYFPARMHTTNQAQTNTYGHHTLINYSIETPFMGKIVQKPNDAVVDNSSSKRAE